MTGGVGDGFDGELQRRRFPPDGDVERWVREGPPGHVDYLGGPVEWEPVIDRQ
jgi:hypothetical protein